MSQVEDAIKKHGSAVDAVLNEPWEGWEIGSAMRLNAMMFREIAAAEKQRRNRKE